jgi:hypothetical protein
MKKYLYFLMSAMLVVLSAGCSKDDSGSSPLLGTWEMEKSYIGYDAADERVYSLIGEDEVIADFQENGLLNVRRKSEQPIDDYFLPSGNYTYSFTKDLFYLNTDNENYSKWNYIIEKNSLSISFCRKLDMNSYPGPSIIYIFRKK